MLGDLRAGQLYLVRLRGRIGEDESLRSILIAGSETTIDAYNSFFFARQPEEKECLKSLKRFDLKAELLQHAADADDLLIAQAWPWQRHEDQPWLPVEAWSQAVLDFPLQHASSDEALLQFLRGRTSSMILRRVRKYRKSPFRCENLMADDDQLEDYFKNYYEPLVTSRHGDNAHLMSLAVMQALGGAGVEKRLLYLYQGDRRVAGMLLLYDRVRLRLLIQEYGVMPELIDDEALFQSLYTAMNYEAIVYAWRHGLREVSFGGGQNQLKSGVYFYKKQWGCRFERDRKREPVLFAFNPNAETFILRQAPLLLHHSKGAYGLFSVSLSEQMSAEEMLEAVVKEANRLACWNMNELVLKLAPRYQSVLRPWSHELLTRAKVPVRLVA